MESDLYYLRWGQPADLGEVLENECHTGDPWDEEQLRTHLKQRNCIHMVASYENRVVGHMVYTLLKHRLIVNRFVVAGWRRRRGVGLCMLERLITKLKDPRNTLVFKVPEWNLDGQGFLKKQGFEGHLIDDQIVFKWTLQNQRRE